MRAFVAVEIDEAVRARLAEVRSSGRLHGSAVRWVRPDRMHITMKFIGEMDPLSVPLVTKAIQSASQGVRPFEVEFASVGVFPDLKRPRVFWAGIRDAGKNLEIVYNRLEAELSKLEFKSDRKPFLPHLTLARIKGKPSGRVDLEEGRDLSFGRQTVKKVTLFESVLRPEGPIYTPLSTVTLEESS
ncbi:MAG: RNA 2',3'-cyclic phosphodiesterase [Planctomycetes bacterium]|nr:RNA 2',3'-cyclic phosphodiesterase [Planctomycetota bacterium]